MDGKRRGPTVARDGMKRGMIIRDGMKEDFVLTVVERRRDERRCAGVLQK